VRAIETATMILRASVRHASVDQTEERKVEAVSSTLVLVDVVPPNGLALSVDISLPVATAFVSR